MITSNFSYDTMYEARSPQTLRECISPDPLAEKLRKIARGFEIAGILSICGLLIIAVYKFVYDISEYVLNNFLTIAISVFCACILNAFIFAALSKIVNSTRTTAKLLEYQVICSERKGSKAESTVQNVNSISKSDEIAEDTQDNAGWLCESCNTRNSQGSVYCKSCGKKRV